MVKSTKDSACTIHWVSAAKAAKGLSARSSREMNTRGKAIRLFVFPHIFIGGKGLLGKAPGGIGTVGFQQLYARSD